ncbi:amidohydrolase family protein [Porifericola rhodea]|uniref:amidohydrolase family protein n=1 Tax=Porifericola rhodea TaxID=930972 RepID=UPI002665EB6D|nr:amidohydrolase family protein [Porifericola rhodea]WKN30122.1 amidohydrolase family protein [Porifericola rhodea]
MKLWIQLQPKRSFILAATFLLTLARAQAQVPTPGDPQEQAIIVLGGTVHIGNGEVIENGAVAFENGEITMVGSASEAQNMDLSGYEQIQAEGKHIYPGFILPDTDLGLVEIGAVRATVDNEEEGSLNPNVRSIISYNTDSELIPTFRFNGILSAQIVPEGGMIPGTSSIVQLDAWNWEDAAVVMDDAMHMNWPGRFRTEFDYSTYTIKRVANERYPEQVQKLKDLFEDAVAYHALEDNKTVNLKLDALQNLFNGNKALHIHAEEAGEIAEAVIFAKEQGVERVVVVGGYEAYLVADLLKEHNVPVIVDNVHRLPVREENDVNLPYKLPNMLKEAGLKVSLAYRIGMNSRSRNLPFLAGTAAAYGLGKEEALKMITANTAEILGIDDILGTLEQGKHATLFVSAGDALDMRTNQVEHAFIQGRKVKLDAMQQRLFEKYKEKYSQSE